MSLVRSSKSKPDYMMNKNDFKWNTEKKIALLNDMIKLRPIGMNKHLNMLLIKENISKNFKKTVPTGAIWKYINSHWNTDVADKIDKNAKIHDLEDFDLPKDEEWVQLIQKQNKILNLNDKNKDVFNRAAINNVDLKTMKSVKIMVEKLDSHSLLINCLKLNKIFNWEKIVKNALNGFQTESTSSNTNISAKRKLSNCIDIDADNNLLTNIVDDQLSTLTMLKKKSKSSSKNHISSTSISCNNNSAIKKECLNLTKVSKPKKSCLDKSISSSNMLEHTSDTEVKNIRSSSIIKRKLIVSHSLNSFASKNLTTYNTKDLNVSKNKKFDNVLKSKQDFNLRKNIYKLRTRATSSIVASSRAITSKELTLNNNVISDINTQCMLNTYHP